MSKRLTVVYTSGSWDLFHVGHLNMLLRSKRLGDRLIVGVSTDELIREYKNVGPVIPYVQRFAIVKNIGCVDKVVKQTILTDKRQLIQHKVDIVTIGDDWRGRYLPGLEWMKEHGRVVYLRYTEGISTTSIKRKIIKNAYDILYAELRREVQAGEEYKRKVERRMKEGNV